MQAKTKAESLFNLSLKTKLMINWLAATGCVTNLRGRITKAKVFPLNAVEESFSMEAPDVRFTLAVFSVTDVALRKVQIRRGKTSLVSRIRTPGFSFFLALVMMCSADGVLAYGQSSSTADTRFFVNSSKKFLSFNGSEGDSCNRCHSNTKKNESLSLMRYAAFHR